MRIIDFTYTVHTMNIIIFGSVYNIMGLSMTTIFTRRCHIIIFRNPRGCARRNQRTYIILYYNINMCMCCPTDRENIIITKPAGGLPQPANSVSFVSRPVSVVSRKNVKSLLLLLLLLLS